MADPPHLLKNLKSSLLSQDFTLPDDIVKAENLPTNIVSKKYLKELMDFQRDSILYYQEKLVGDILDPSHFDKMKVAPALNILSSKTSDALKAMVEFHNFDHDRLTTAWFCETIGKWFKIVAGRDPSMSMSYGNEDIYNERVAFLMGIINLFENIKIGNGQWKPLQKGFILTTKTFLEAHQICLDSGLNFFLGSRFSQDALENLFSLVRARMANPTAKDFQDIIRLILLGQLTSDIKSSNYQYDDSSFLAEFLDYRPKPTQEEEEDDNFLNNFFSEFLPEFIANQVNATGISDGETLILYYLAGYIIYKIEKHNSTCNTCLTSVKVHENNPLFELEKVNKLIKIKDYTGHSLVHTDAKVFHEIFVPAEIAMRSMEYKLINMEKDVFKNLFEAISFQTQSIILPNCHGIKSKILSRFVNLRLKVMAQRLRQKRHLPQNINKKQSIDMGSKTMAMKGLAKNIKNNR